MPAAHRTAAAVKHAVAHAPRIPWQAAFAVVSVGGFVALVLQNEVSPLLVYCLQLFLSA